MSHDFVYSQLLYPSPIGRHHIVDCYFCFGTSDVHYALLHSFFCGHNQIQYFLTIKYDATAPIVGIYQAYPCSNEYTKFTFGKQLVDILLLKLAVLIIKLKMHKFKKLLNYPRSFDNRGKIVLNLEASKYFQKQRLPCRIYIFHLT